MNKELKKIWRHRLKSTVPSPETLITEGTKCSDGDHQEKGEALVGHNNYGMNTLKNNRSKLVLSNVWNIVTWKRMREALILYLDISDLEDRKRLKWINPSWTYIRWYLAENHAYENKCKSAIVNRHYLRYRI